jgi:hypothetical protein
LRKTLRHRHTPAASEGRGDTAPAGDREKVVAEEQLWLGRNGERFGPYGDALVRQWLAEGKLEWSTLAWRSGMADWLPLSQILQAETATFSQSPPFTPPPPAPPSGIYGDSPGEAELRRRLPEPPSMHWFVVLLLTIVTLGIFGVVWPFIQASWVKKVDPSSKAGTYLVGSLACVGISWIAQIGLRIFGMGHGATALMSLGGLGFILAIANLVLVYMAYFGMANSMRRVLPSYGVTPEIGGVTLFFFTLLYLQGQMRWLARWKSTGQTFPAAPKVIFWCLWLVLPVTGAIVMFALLSAYQGH